MNLNNFFHTKLEIFQCSSHAQKSYYHSTVSQQIGLISQQFTWKDGRESMSNAQIWGRLKAKCLNIELCFMWHSKALVASAKLEHTVTKSMCSDIIVATVSPISYISE